MRIKYDHEATDRVICDGCGKEAGDHCTEFTIQMDYGSEDDCFGSSGDEYELFHQYEDVDLREYLAQHLYEFCQDCRCGDNYARVFEDAARASRVKLIRKMIEEKTLPCFEDVDLMREEKLKEIKEREKTTMRRLRESVGHDASDYAIMSIASELAGIQREVTILEYESWKLKT